MARIVIELRKGVVYDAYSDMRDVELVIDDRDAGGLVRLYVVYDRVDVDSVFEAVEKAAK